MNLMDGNKQYKFLVETALLGHGLKSIEDDFITSLWPKDVNLAWVEKGKIMIGSIFDFILSKKENKNWERLDGEGVLENNYKDKNAFLTASGTMALAKKISCPLVVSCGIGGIGDIKDEQISYDLPALAEMEVSLLATSVKDMLDIEGSLSWLHENGVKTYGYDTRECTGYVFILPASDLKNKVSEDDLKSIPKGYNLILNPIPEEKRFKDLAILKQAILAGKTAEDRGEYYHPAANEYIDKATKGLSSIIQLESLISNINIAKEIKIV